MQRRDLDRLLLRVLALSLPAASGCGGVDTAGFAPVACGDEGSPAYLKDVALVEPADYLELRRFETGAAGDARVLQRAGTPCAGATDAEACSAAIASASSETGFQLGQCVQLCEEHYLIVNRGDEVLVVSRAAELRALLGPVDAPADALLVVSLEGYHVPCEHDEGGVKTVSGGHEVLATRLTNACEPVETTLFRLRVSEAGGVTELESDVVHSSNACVGRRPAGLRRALPARSSALGAYFAEVSHLEAASVHAFARLRRELRHHGAPPRLLRAAERAMRDEVRHAAVTRTLAARFGATAPRPRVEKLPVRPLEAIAIENAVEGCVRETFGALVGAWQARLAGDPAVRAAMGPIARDEARHAALAWAVDAWARRRLSPSFRLRLDEARCEALLRLREEAEREVPSALVRAAGLPDAERGAALARRFVEAFAAS